MGVTQKYHDDSMAYVVSIYVQYKNMIALTYLGIFTCVKYYLWL